MESFMKADQKWIKARRCSNNAVDCVSKYCHDGPSHRVAPQSQHSILIIERIDESRVQSIEALVAVRFLVVLFECTAQIQRSCAIRAHETLRMKLLCDVSVRRQRCDHTTSDRARTCRAVRWRRRLGRLLQAHYLLWKL
jgi:hypothetical protein